MDQNYQKNPKFEARNSRLRKSVFGEQAKFVTNSNDQSKKFKTISVLWMEVSEGHL
jgi:hypothetical protein